MRVVTWAEDPGIADRGVDSAAVWPEYNLHGDVFDTYWDRMLDRFPACQFALLDGDVVVAEGHTIPLAWDGRDESLPGGIDDAIRLGVDGDGVADTLCAMAAEVNPDVRQRGVSGEILGAMRSVAASLGLARLIAPVRPSWKERYPLAPIERYITWRRADGTLLDPWMRLHERLGARVGPPLPESMLISGTVAEWSSWTGLEFPESGAYVFPHGLAPVTVSLEEDLARYWEPNVWMIHPAIEP